MKLSDSDLIGLEYNGELEALKVKIIELESLNQVLMKVIKDNDLQDEIDMDIQMITDEEYICMNEIRKIKDRSESHGLSEEDAKIFDTMHKNLRTIRGLKVEKPKKKKQVDVSELLKIVNGEIK
jgi:hypothetical protein